MTKRLSIILIFVCLAPVASAYVASSTNYRLEADSVNIGGTEDGASTNYKLRDTVGEVGTGISSSASYQVSAGYRAMLEPFISISSPGNVTLSPSISGVSGGTGTGNAEWTVITDAAAGYTLMVQASTNPAMQSGSNSFADYTPAGANPDYTWSVAATASEFGFSPRGVDITTEYSDNGSACNAGSGDTLDTCWRGFSTTNETIADASTANAPSGATTSLQLRAEVGASKNQAAGTYTATITLTAIAN